jgi:hypothetical protein
MATPEEGSALGADLHDAAGTADAVPFQVLCQCPSISPLGASEYATIFVCYPVPQRSHTKAR